MKDGTWMLLRSPEPSDAAARIEYLRRVNGETDFMARGGKDSPSDAELVAQVIADQLDSEDMLEIAAWMDGRMVACGGISPVSRSQPRRRHRAQLGIAVLKECWNRGVGGAIVRALIAEAPKLGYRQIELTVVDGNDRALALYEKLGFQVVGRMPGGMGYEDGSFRDEITMVRML